MEFIVYIYASKQPVSELQPFRCQRCGRIVLRSSSTKIQLSNAYGAPIKDMTAGSTVIEHKCHSCKALYQILFQ